MESNYQCPECKSFLQIGENLIFTIHATKGGKRGLIILNPGVGNYAYINHPSFKFEEGEMVEFYCPVCHENLTAYEISNHLVKVIYLDSEGMQYELYFSKIAGEHTTFKIERDSIIEKYGEDSSSYLNYFMAKLNEKLKNL